MARHPAVTARKRPVSTPTGRRKPEQNSVRESTLRLRQVLDALPTAAYTCDADGLITYFNQRARKIWGRAPKLNDPADRFCGSFKLFNHDGLPICHDECWMALALKERRALTGKKIQIERPDGSRQLALAYASPLFNSKGKLTGGVNVLIDTTDYSQTEAEMQSTNTLLSSILENLPAMVLVKDAVDLRFVRLNRAAEALSGYSREELLGRSDYEFFPKAEADVFTRKDREVLQLGQVIDIPEESIETRNRGTRMLHTRKVPIFDRDGTPRYLLGISEDITEWKQAELAERKRAIKLGRQQFALCELAKHEAIYTGDLQRTYRVLTETAGHVLEVDRASLWLLQDEGSSLQLVDLYERSSDGHRSGTTLWAKEYPAYFSALVEEVYAIAADDAHTDRRTMEFSQSYLTPLGIGAMLDAPIRVNGKVVGVLCNEHVGGTRPWTPEEIHFASSLATFVTLATEAHHRKEFEQALLSAKESAEVASRAKGQFLAGVSHEIRTPMNAIIGMADLLWETDLSPEQRKYLRIFRRAGDNLLHLINDILDISKIEEGHIELESIEFDLNELIEKAIEILAMRANEKGIELACHLATDVPCSLIGDPNRLQQILVNLISNAIKFTDQGSVVVEVANDPDYTSPGSIRFSVTDTGIGIPPDKLGTIFEGFTQAHASITRRYGGTGLGLTIAKQLAELMNGEIWVESTLGQGSTFHCHVQLSVNSSTISTQPALPFELRHLRTLVVDDHPVNRKILSETLTGWQAEVSAVASGREAVAELLSAADTAHPYRLLLLDCRMPDMDGFQVVEEISRSTRLASLMIIMLASAHWADDIARTYDLGLTGYLTKPIRRSDLLQSLSIALDRARGISSKAIPASPAPPLSSKPLHILLVEDSPDNQLLVRSYLKQTSHQLDVADHGGLAVEQVKRSQYDLILMDMNMPVMDGYEATRHIRAWEQKHDLPPTHIIALTASALKEDGEKIIQVGCNAHLMKPIKRRTLLEVLEACKGHREI